MATKSLAQLNKQYSDLELEIRDCQRRMLEGVKPANEIQFLKRLVKSKESQLKVLANQIQQRKKQNDQNK